MGLDTFSGVLSALATTGALIAAIVAGIQAKRLYLIDSKRDQQAGEEARRLHATRVSSWAAMRLLPSGEPIYGVVLRNSSNDPVYDVHVTVHGFTSKRAPLLRCVPPGEYFVANRDKRKSDGRIYRWDYMRPVREITDLVRPFTASDGRRVEELTFRDNAGVAWCRTARGGLERV